MLPPESDPWLQDTIALFAGKERCTVVNIGVATDHVHVIVEFPSTCTIANVVQRMKGGSAHEWNQCASHRLTWQDGYWSETLSPTALPVLARYLDRQRERHAIPGFAERWEHDLISPIDAATR